MQNEASHRKGSPYKTLEGELPFYGRRRGRPLRPQQKKLFEAQLPKWQIAEDVKDLQSCFDHKPQDIYLEIGFGGGEHLASIAEASPEAGFLGAEPFINGVASLVRHIDEGGLQNIRIWPDDVRLILDNLPDNCLAGAYIMFPDPWPKRRHAARRILQPSMRARLARLIRSGGVLRMASDHALAKSWLLAEAMADERFEWQAKTAQDWRTRPEKWPETRYMEKAYKEGRAPSWFEFVRL